MGSPAPSVGGSLPARRSDVEPLGVFYRRVHLEGCSLVVALPPSALRALGVERGEYVQVQVEASGSVTLTAMQGAATDQAGRGSEPARVARLARRVVKLERKLARAYHSGIGEGFTLGYLHALTSGAGPLASFLADYRAGRVLVLPVGAPAADPPSSG